MNVLEGSLAESLPACAKAVIRQGQLMADRCPLSNMVAIPALPAPVRVVHRIALRTGRRVSEGNIWAVAEAHISDRHGLLVAAGFDSPENDVAARGWISVCQSRPVLTFRE